MSIERLKNKYRFKDFTLKNYSDLLKLALENYSCQLIKNYSQEASQTVFLRHDLEFSVPIAEKMAQIEHDLGIKATYLIQLHSEFYNPLDKESYNSINKIKELGHDIGLHFDSHFWCIKNEKELEHYIKIDKQTLEKYFDIEINVFSFHNTNEFTLSCEEEHYAGLINVYSKYLKEKVGYTADSTGYWRYEILEERLKEAKDNQLQILIHDGMWQDEILPPRQRVFKVIDDRARFLKDKYDSILKDFGAKNIDWNKIY